MATLAETNHAIPEETENGEEVPEDETEEEKQEREKNKKKVFKFNTASFPPPKPAPPPPKNNDKAFNIHVHKSHIVSLDLVLDTMRNVREEEKAEKLPKSHRPPRRRQSVSDMFEMKLRADQETKQKNKAKNVAQMKNDIKAMLTKMGIEDVKDDYITDLRRYFNQLTETEMAKADADCLHSTWTINQFQSYLDSDIDISGMWIEPKEPIPEKLFKEIKKNFITNGQVYAGCNSKTDLPIILSLLTSYRLSEHTVRAFISGLFVPICAHLKIEMLVEETHRNTLLTAIRYNNILKACDGKMIGVVSIKHSEEMTPNAIVHCILQLLALQQDRASASTLFGLVTDAKQYVFIVLEQERLLLEVAGSNILVREGITWDELEHVINIIYSLCKGDY